MQFIFTLKGVLESKSVKYLSRLKILWMPVEKIFGPGVRLLEIQIMKSLYRKIGRPLGNEKLQDLVFAEYVATARKNFKGRL